MKASTCSLFASLTPLRSTAIHNYHTRASFKVVSSRKYSAHVTKKRQHLPPWFSVAPMMDWTDNHYRTLARLISKHAWLYTEMVVAETIVHQQDNLDRFLAFPPEQHPIVLQIGGSNLDNLSKGAELANGYGYDGINLNLGKYKDEKEVHGVHVRNCTLKNTLNGVRVKSWRGAPPSAASDINFEDIIMEGVKNPVLIDQEYCASGKTCRGNQPSQVKLSNILFKNIRGILRS